MTTKPQKNYMKGVGKNDITPEYNKNLRYANVRPLVSFVFVDSKIGHEES